MTEDERRLRLKITQMRVEIQILNRVVAMLLHALARFDREAVERIVGQLDTPNIPKDFEKDPELAKTWDKGSTQLVHAYEDWRKKLSEKDRTD